MDARIVALVTNIPGPLAAARLAELGAHVVKLEPPAGDPLASAAPDWYADLTRKVRVLRADLRSDAGRQHVRELLGPADLLITAMRGTALARAGLAWSDLHARFPDLCHVAIIGEAAPDDDRAGHDLTYQARAGLLSPPAMPHTVYADLFAAERAVSESLAALYDRDRTGVASRREVAVAQAATALVDPVRYGLTGHGGPLSGTLPVYALYRASDGWIALAALEAHFRERLMRALRIETLDAAALNARFAEHPRAYWESVAAEYDLPLAAVVERV
jgi:crotonobetainyl-CoA:carnitine CoA-transferase CaiB-like acyl-CoA transferase